jgi:photosystem II stability/assembly factor-like uncharacterized protein
MDISTRIDGYPTSLSCSPDEQLYVGAQMRSDGYLFVSEDEGKHWNPVLIDEDVETCRYGYAPVFNEEKSQAYILLECDGSYALYLSEDALSTWKKIGTFSLEDEDSVEQYFLSEDQIYIHTSQDKTYLLEGATKE